MGPARTRPRRVERRPPRGESVDDGAEIYRLPARPAGVRTRKPPPHLPYGRIAQTNAPGPPTTGQLPWSFTPLLFLTAKMLAPSAAA